MFRFRTQREHLHEVSPKSIWRLLLWLWGTWRGNRLQACLNATTGIAWVVTSLASVWAVKHAIDIASGSCEGSLYVAVGIMALIVLCDFAINISRVWIKNILGVRAQNRMRWQILHRLLRAEWRGKERFHSGDIINRLELDVGVVVEFLTETLPNTLSVMAMFVGAFVYLYRMDATLSLITVAIMPLFILLSRIYVSRMRRFNRQVRGSDSRIQGIMQETIQHRVVIKTLECCEEMCDRLDTAQQELSLNVRRRTRFSVLSNLFLNAGFSSGYLIAFLWSAFKLYGGAITFGTMTAFLQLVHRIQSPARDIAKLAPAFVSVFTAAERLMDLEEIPLEEQGNSLVMKGPCGIRLTEIEYKYEDGKRTILNDLTYDFKPGTCTAVLGETGAGKTTLVRILLALLQPLRGKVEIYDSFGTTFSLSSLTRSNFIYVPQGNTLFSGTIRDNLLLGNPVASEEEMLKVLDLACASFVFDMTSGLDTSISEAGAGLSEGQAQRIAIARALLRPGSILLFDEATSALDPLTERKLLDNLLSDKQRTVIFITHRNTVTEYCDNVLKIERIS